MHGRCNAIKHKAHGNIPGNHLGDGGQLVGLQQDIGGNPGALKAVQNLFRLEKAVRKQHQRLLCQIGYGNALIAAQRVDPRNAAHGLHGPHKLRLKLGQRRVVGQQSHIDLVALQPLHQRSPAAFHNAQQAIALLRLIRSIQCRQHQRADHGRHAEAQLLAPG